MRSVKDLIDVNLKNDVLTSMEFGFKSVRDHVPYGRDGADGKTVELLVASDGYKGYSDPDKNNYGETITVHHIGANDGTYAGFEKGAPCTIEVQEVRLRCSAFRDSTKDKLCGFISDMDLYGKVQKGGKR